MDDAELIQRCLSYFADLNGSEWIKGDDPGSKDMRQRATALHRQLADRVYRPALNQGEFQ